MKFLEDICEAYSKSAKIYGYSTKTIFDTTSIYIVPMVNPDGVDLVNGAISQDSNVYFHCKQIASFFPSIPFTKGWKANTTGVDFKIYQPKLTHTYLLKKISPYSRIF